MKRFNTSILRILKKRDSKYILITLLVLFGVYWRLVGADIRGANDFPYSYQENVSDGFNLPQLWSARGNGLGSRVINILWGWPYDFIYGLGSTLGIKFSLLFRILHILPIFVIGLWSIRRLLKYYNFNQEGILIGSLVFLINTPFILLIDGGQLSLALAYSFMPVAFLEFKKAVSGNLRQKITASLCVYILAVFDARFIYLLLVLLGINFIVDLFIQHKSLLILLRQYFLAGLITSVSLLGLNLYWIIPQMKIGSSLVPATYQRVTQTTFLSFATWKNAMLLLQPHWYLNVFGRITPILKQFLLLPLLAFFSIYFVLLKKGKENNNYLKIISLWLLIALIAAFFIKGVNPPFGNVYSWAFIHIPGFSLFRDPTKFFFLVALSYSVLIGLSVGNISDKFDKKITISNLNFGLIPLLLIIYLFFLVKPVWLGEMTGILSVPYYKNDFLKQADIIQKDQGFGRMLSIPSRTVLDFASPLHPMLGASDVSLKRPFGIGTVGTYESLNFLREAPFMGEIFKVAGIKYISYPYPDTRREELKQDNVDYYYSFFDQIANLPWIKGKLMDIPIPLLEVNESIDHFFAAGNLWFVVGSDRIYWDLMNVSSFDLSENALVFAEDSPALIKRARENIDSKILVYDKTGIDLAASYIDNENFIFPAKNIDFEPSVKSESEGWWKREGIDFVWWRDFLQQKYSIDNIDLDYGGGWAIAEGEKILNLNDSLFSKDKILLARVMQSSRGGDIEFLQDGQEIGLLNTKNNTSKKVEVKLTGYKEIPDTLTEYDKADFFWEEVGELKDSTGLVIKTKGDINAINALISVDKNEWESIKNNVNNSDVYYWHNLSDEQKDHLFAGNANVDIDYQRISPTHYKVNVTGVEKPVILAFSENYDNLWLANERSSLPLYTLINGFEVEKNGTYDVYFSAQKYVIPGIILSFFILVIIIYTYEKSEK